MLRLRTTGKCGRTIGSFLLGLTLAAGSSAVAATGDEPGSSVLTGVVRDAQGVAQMGVLVQVLSPHAHLVASAFTDEHGRYTILHLLPGQYRVRASSAMFAPATRSLLEIDSSARTIVNLTLATLFDTAAWLPARTRRVDEPEDEWRWTLRSSADRPILRFDGSDQEGVADLHDEGRKSRAIHGTMQSGLAAGGFEASGARQAITLERTLSNGYVTTMQVESGGGETNELQMRALLERTQGAAGEMRTLLEYRSEPGVKFSEGSTGLQVARMVNAQQIKLGDSVEIDAGGVVDLVRAGSATLLTDRPFVRLLANPGKDWKVEYRLGTERGTQDYADVRADQAIASQADAEKKQTVALSRSGAVEMESGQHQELSLSHPFGQGNVQAAYYHDALTQVALHGTGLLNELPGDAAGLTEAQANGAFAMLVHGYTSNGARIAYSAPIRDGIWIVAEYALGDAMTCSELSMNNQSLSRAQVSSHSSQAALVSIGGKLHHSTTQVRASYRWQPTGDISAVDAYGPMSDQAFLSMMARRQVRFGSWLPSGMEATVEISNLLAQGYRPFLSLDGKTLYLAQTPRTVQVGLAFNF